jgi:hypothetical protein
METKYANAVTITTGPYDFVFDFLFRAPENQLEEDPAKFENVARVAMSHAHAKSMLPIMARLLADFESQFGEIPAPGFKKFGSE